MAVILLVDDERALREIVARHLEGLGHVVRQAAHGGEALVQLVQGTPDLLITDLVMPEREGVELIIEVRRRWPALPIIAISGGGRLEDPAAYLAVAKGLGADRTLGKPFGLRALEQVVEELLAATRT